MNQRKIELYEDAVRFEDVDAAALVYHPIYLTYLERARNQVLVKAGYSFKRILDEKLGFVVASVDMKYIRPLRLEDRFIVATQVNDYGASFVNVTQVITGRSVDISSLSDLKSELREIAGLNFYAHLKLVVISQETARPTSMPEAMLAMIENSGN